EDLVLFEVPDHLCVRYREYANEQDGQGHDPDRADGLCRPERDRDGTGEGGHRESEYRAGDERDRGDGRREFVYIQIGPEQAGRDPELANAGQDDVGGQRDRENTKVVRRQNVRDDGRECDIGQAQQQVACDYPESSPPHARRKRSRIAPGGFGIGNPARWRISGGGHTEPAASGGRGIARSDPAPTHAHPPTAPPIQPPPPPGQNCRDSHLRGLPSPRATPDDPGTLPPPCLVDASSTQDVTAQLA